MTTGNCLSHQLFRTVLLKGFSGEPSAAVAFLACSIQKGSSGWRIGVTGNHDIMW